MNKTQELCQLISNSIIDSEKYLNDIENILNKGANSNGYKHRPISCAFKIHEYYSELKVKIMLLLLNHGADSNYVEHENNSFLNYIVQHGSVSQIEEALKYCDSSDPVNEHAIFHAIMKNNCVELVELLVKHGANINAVEKDIYGLMDTPLSFAVRNRNFNVIDLLIDSGASLKAKDYKGSSILAVSLFYHSNNGSNKEPELKEVVKKLIGRGVDINEVDKNGETFIIKIISHKPSRQMFEFLIDLGADVNFQDINGKTALMKAASDGGIETIRNLLINGADPSIRNKSGRNACEVFLEHRYRTHHSNVKESDLDDFGREIIKMFNAAEEQFALKRMIDTSNQEQEQIVRF